jgi:Ala-tRNA(Pro) deacylase
MSEYLKDLKKRLGDAGARFESISTEPVYTAQEAAAAAHVPGHAFAKSVVVSADGRPILLTLPAPHIIDTEVLGQRLASKDVRLAVEEDFGDLFPGCELGAIPPFAPSADVPLYADRGLLASREISFKMGSHTEIARLNTEDYLRLATPQVLDFALEPAMPLPEAESKGVGVLRAAAQSGWPYAAIAAAAGLTLPALAWRTIRQSWLRRTIATFAAGVAVGGALVALTDPRLGRRRRALVRDKGRHFLRLGLHRGSGAVKQFRDRSKGLQHRMRHRTRVGRDAGRAA